MVQYDFSNSVLYGFSILIISYWCLLWIHHAVAIVSAKIKLHRRVDSISDAIFYSGVSIIKPLLGSDPNLSSNLETFFTMDYENFEILFCVADEDDPAIKIVNNLMSKYPTIKSNLLIGKSSVGVNPKINNMQSGYIEAIHPLILISDSGIRMKSDTLKDMVERMTENVGLVHQLPFVCDKDEGLVSIIEKIFFGTSHARIYLVANLLNLNCVTGMSFLVRKSLIDDVGGLQTFGPYLAEDYFIAKSVKERGWKLKLSGNPALQNASGYGLDHLRNRLMRWCKLRLKMVPFVIFLEPFSQCIVIGLLGSWAGTHLFGWNSMAFFMVHIFVWFLFDWILLSVVQNGPLRMNKFVFLIGWILRELDWQYLFLSALVNPLIIWRDKTYRVNWGGVAEKIGDKQASKV